MNLELKQLQYVVTGVMKEEKAMKVLVSELKKNLGMGIMVSNNLKEIALAANEQIDIMEASGHRIDRSKFKVSVLLEAANSSIPSVRKLAARLLPAKFGSKLVLDPVSSVRCSAAKNAPSKLVIEAVKKYPRDYQLQAIAKDLLKEAGLPKPTPAKDEFDMYGKAPLGSVVKSHPQHEGDDFPETWYIRIAKKICNDYGGNLERNWEEVAATNFCSHYYSTSKVIIDRDKLLEAIYDCIEERENQVVKEGHGANIIAHLDKELLQEAFMPIIEEKYDPIAELLESRMTSVDYVTKAEKLFNVRKSIVPPGIKKYCVNEGRNTEISIPVKGQVPGGFNSRSELALDRYVEAWNKQQALRGEPYQLSWTPHPASIDMVGFHLQLK